MACQILNRADNMYDEELFLMPFCAQTIAMDVKRCFLKSKFCAVLIHYYVHLNKDIYYFFGYYFIKCVYGDLAVLGESHLTHSDTVLLSPYGVRRVPVHIYTIFNKPIL